MPRLWRKDLPVTICSSGGRFLFSFNSESPKPRDTARVPTSKRERQDIWTPRQLHQTSNLPCKSMSLALTVNQCQQHACKHHAQAYLYMHTRYWPFTRFAWTKPPAATIRFSSSAQEKKSKTSQNYFKASVCMQVHIWTICCSSQTPKKWKPTGTLKEGKVSACANSGKECQDSWAVSACSSYATQWRIEECTLQMFHTNTTPIQHNPGACTCRSRFSPGLYGLWSNDRGTARPDTEATARESPTFACDK